MEFMRLYADRGLLGRSEPQPLCRVCPNAGPCWARIPRASGATARNRRTDDLPAVDRPPLLGAGHVTARLGVQR
jgi:hypothetical protein